MINLSDDLFLGKGTKRKCFAHPGDPRFCIKITLGRGLRSAKREIRYLNLLRRRGKSLAQIADFKGKVQTNIGEGDLYELVRDCNGKVSGSLRHYLSKTDGVLDEKIVSAIKDLRLYLFDNSILFSDLTADNLLVRVGCDGEIKLIIVDGVGDNNQIQLLEYIKPLGLKHCMKKWDAFVLKTVVEFPALANRIEMFS